MSEWMWYFTESAQLCLLLGEINNNVVNQMFVTKTSSFSNSPTWSKAKMFSEKLYFSYIIYQVIKRFLFKTHFLTEGHGMSIVSHSIFYRVSSHFGADWRCCWWLFMYLGVSGFHAWVCQEIDSNSACMKYKNKLQIKKEILKFIPFLCRLLTTLQ